MEPVRFDAPWDGGVNLITTAASAVIAGCAVLLVWVGANFYAAYQNPVILPVPLVLLLVPLLLLFAAWQVAPGGFSIDASSVQVKRRSGPISIPIVSIRDVRELQPPVFLSRVGGSGGFFGYYGEVQTPELGTVKVYATRSDGQVVLATGSGTYVATRSSPERFVAEVRRRLGLLPG